MIAIIILCVVGILCIVGTMVFAILLLHDMKQGHTNSDLTGTYFFILILLVVGSGVCIGAAVQEANSIEHVTTK